MDPQSARLAGATITVKADASAFEQKTVTEANGEFVLSRIPAGSYTVEVEHVGFQSLSEPLVLRLGSSVDLHFAMKVATATSTQHVTGDISCGMPWGRHWSTGITVLNIANSRFLLGLDSAFAGTHYSPPLEIIGQLSYRFNYR